MFAGLDRNGDGTISKDEMAELIMKVAGIRRSPQKRRHLEARSNRSRSRSGKRFDEDFLDGFDRQSSVAKQLANVFI